MGRGRCVLRRVVPLDDAEERVVVRQGHGHHALHGRRDERDGAEGRGRVRVGEKLGRREEPREVAQRRVGEDRGEVPAAQPLEVFELGLVPEIDLVRRLLEELGRAVLVDGFGASALGDVSLVEALHVGEDGLERAEQLEEFVALALKGLLVDDEERRVALLVVPRGLAGIRRGERRVVQGSGIRERLHPEGTKPHRRRDGARHVVVEKQVQVEGRPPGHCRRRAALG